MTESDRQRRKDALVASMTARLRPLCESWPEAEFLDMVFQLAEITMKYEGRTTVGTYDRRSTDQLVAELKDSLARSERIRRSRGES